MHRRHFPEFGLATHIAPASLHATQWRQRTIGRGGSAVPSSRRGKTHVPVGFDSHSMHALLLSEDVHCFPVLAHSVHCVVAVPCAANAALTAAAMAAEITFAKSMIFCFVKWLHVVYSNVYYY